MTISLLCHNNSNIKEQYFVGGIWEGPDIMNYQRYYVDESTLGSLWITIEFEKAVPFSELLPDNYNEIDPASKFGHAATITSTLDAGRRLFLFGLGDKCDRISLF